MFLYVLGLTLTQIVANRSDTDSFGLIVVVRPTAASKENENVSVHSLGKIIKEIWKGSVSRQYSARSCAYSYIYFP